MFGFVAYIKLSHPFYEFSPVPCPASQAQFPECIGFPP